MQRHHLVHGRVRVPPLEKSAVHESGRKKQNPRAADPEKSAVHEPDQEKQNPQVAVLNCKENHLSQRGNLNLKQRVPVKEPGKGRKHGLTGNLKGLRARLLHLNLKSKTNHTSSPRFTRSLDWTGAGLICVVSRVRFDSSRIFRKIFHTDKPGHAGEENYSGHKQKSHVHIRVTANVPQQPERLHVT